MKIGETTFINLCNTPTRLIMKVDAKSNDNEDKWLRIFLWVQKLLSKKLKKELSWILYKNKHC